MNRVFIYEFEDGTVLKLLDTGLSTKEMFCLNSIHGKVTNIYSCRFPRG